MTNDEIKKDINWLIEQSKLLDNMPLPSRPPLVLTDAQIKSFGEAGFLENINYVNIKDFKF